MPDLGRDQAARPDAHVVAHLHEIVDLRSGADDRVVDAAPVDRRVRPDLHVIPDQAAPDLRNLAGRRARLAGDVSEPVAAQPRPGVHDHAISEGRAAVAHDLRVELHCVPDHDSVPQHAARTDTDVAAQAHPVTQHGVGTDRDRFLPHAARTDHRGRMDARCPRGLRIQHRQHGEERDVRVGDDDPARGSVPLFGKLRRAEHHRGLRTLKVGEIAASDKKRELARAGAIERGDALDADRR